MGDNVCTANRVPIAIQHGEFEILWGIRVQWEVETPEIGVAAFAHSFIVIAPAIDHTDPDPGYRTTIVVDDAAHYISTRAVVAMVESGQLIAILLSNLWYGRLQPSRR
jgi:hypothetical protein